MSGLPSPAPERIAIVPEGPPRGRSRARSLLSPAAWLARGFVFRRQQQIWPIGISHATDGAGAGFPGWPSARGGTGGAGRFGGLTIPLPGPALLVKTTTSGHLRWEHGVRFHLKAGAVSHVEVVTQQRRGEGR